MFRLTAADRDDAPALDAAHVRNDRSQHVERTVQVRVEHRAESRVVSFSYGFAASESAYEVRQNIDPAEFPSNRIHSFRRGVATREFSRKSEKCRVLKIALLNVLGNSRHGRARVQ